MNPRQIAAQRVRDEMRNLNEAIAAARGDFALHLHAPVIFVVMHEITHTIPLWFDRQNGDHFLRVEVYPFGEGMTYYRSNPSPTVEQKKCRIRVLLGGQIGEEYFLGRVYPDGGSEEDNDRAMALCKEVITSVHGNIDVNERDRRAVELRHEMYRQMYIFVGHWKRQIKTLARKLFALPLKRLTREDYNRTFRHWEVSPAYWYFEQQLNAARARRDAAMRAEIEIRRALAGGRRAAERRIAHWPEVHTHRSIAQNTAGQLLASFGIPYYEKQSWRRQTAKTRAVQWLDMNNEGRHGQTVTGPTEQQHGMDIRQPKHGNVTSPAQITRGEQQMFGFSQHHYHQQSNVPQLPMALPPSRPFVVHPMLSHKHEFPSPTHAPPSSSVVHVLSHHQLPQFLFGFATWPTVSVLNAFAVCSMSVWIESKARRGVNLASGSPVRTKIADGFVIIRPHLLVLNRCFSAFPSPSLLRYVKRLENERKRDEQMRKRREADGNAGLKSFRVAYD